MKKSIIKFIILLFGLFLASCIDTPEKKIVKSFNNDPIRNEIKAKDAIIYDTIFFEEVIYNFEVFQKNMEYLSNKLNSLDNYRDSIFKLKLPRHIRDSLLRMTREKVRYYDKKIDFLIYKNSFNYKLSNQLDDTISGYYTKIITNKDTFDVVVSPLTFTVVGPSYMHKK